jgi:hypothetical protein
LRVFDGVRAQVGEFDGFDLGPPELDCVEVVGVALERFDHQPRSRNLETVDR